MTMFLCGTSPLYAQEAPTMGDGIIMTNAFATHQVTEQIGIMGSLFTVAVPSTSYSSDFVNVGGYYSFNMHVTLGVTTGGSFNFPYQSNSPLLGVHAWGSILPGLSYYGEFDGMLGSWFYTTHLKYNITDALAVGVWAQGFNDGGITHRIAPMASYTFRSDYGALEFIGAVFYNNANTIQPTAKIVAWL